MTGMWPLFPAVLLLAGMLYFKKQENRKERVPVKGALSAFFIAAAVFQPWPLPVYSGQFLLAYSTSMPEGF